MADNVIALEMFTNLVNNINEVKPKSGVAPAMLTWDSAEWYTPAIYIEAAREVMGCIDTDPASCELANQVVKAKRYYTKEENGFTKHWTGKVWCNPPYGYDSKCNQAQWSARLVEQYEAGITTEAILLVNAAVGTSWYDRMCDYPVCQPKKRINFYSPVPKKHGATHGSALFYLGPQAEKFARVFGQFWPRHGGYECNTLATFGYFVGCIGVDCCFDMTECPFRRKLRNGHSY